MLTLRLAFPWGRYYAHPWGQNPARIMEAEWPPSPWRLLRAFSGTWFQANPGSEPSSELILTLGAVGRELPTFVLPKVSFSRTVQYQPNFGATPKDDASLAKYKRVRHENHFVVVGGDVLIQWQLSGVNEADARVVRSVIRNIAGRIGYFGRAESVCEVEVVDSERDCLDRAQVALQSGKPCREIGSIFRDVLCPNPDDFQPSDLWRRRDDNSGAEVAQKHLVQELINAPQPLPDGAAWFSCRMPEGWPHRWIVRQVQPPKRRGPDHRIVAHFLEFSLQCRIPVPTKFTVSIAELFRHAAIRNHSQPSFALSGHDRPHGLEAGHQHSFYLPIPDDSGQYLSLLRVWCPYGFTQQEVSALLAVGALRWAGGRFPARAVLLRVQCDLPQPRPSLVWRSVTPFVPPRYWYRKRFAEGRVREPYSPENQLRSCFRETGTDPSSAIIQRVEVANSNWEICKVHQHEDTRSRRSDSTHRVGLMLNVIFPTPTVLPFPSYGHSAHFGLCQFAPVME